MKPTDNHDGSTPRRVTFTFEGQTLSGTEGEPIAKALFQTGIRTLSHSVKYNRPRSLHCARGRCGMCNMEVNGIPGVPTCTTPLEEGMVVQRENFRPFYAPLLTFGLKSVPLPAGFYYRSLTRPAALRNVVLNRLRSMTGIGRVTPEPGKLLKNVDESALSRLESTYGVVVVGAGLSGMAAAVEAAGAGGRVLLVDEHPFLGGNHQGVLSDTEHTNARNELIEQVRGHSSIEWVSGTSANGFYPPDTLLIGSTSGMRKITARSFVFATGATDLVPLFEDNDLPGIFGERAVRLLLERDDLVIGKTAVIYGASDGVEDLIDLLSSRNVKVAAVIDPILRESSPMLSEKSVPHMRGTTVTRAHGREWISGVTYSSLRGGNDGSGSHIACDMLCIAFKGQPSYELPYQAGIQFELSKDSIEEERVMIPQSTSVTGDVSIYLAGEVTGEHNWKKKIEQGRHAGKQAVTEPASNR